MVFGKHDMSVFMINTCLYDIVSLSLWVTTIYTFLCILQGNISCVK